MLDYCQNHVSAASREVQCLVAERIGLSVSVSQLNREAKNRHRHPCLMDTDSPLPFTQPVAFFLRRRYPKYRDTLLDVVVPD